MLPVSNMSLRPRPDSVCSVSSIRLKHVLEVGAKVTSKTTPFTGNGFLYLVADSVAGVKGPVVLLVGEKAYKADKNIATSSDRKWSPPGGGYKDKDRRNLENTAWREFEEETGATLSNLRKGSYKWTTLHTGQGSVTMMLRIRLPAEKVEQIIGMKSMGSSLTKKMDTDLSNETKGYVWVTLDALRNVDKHNLVLNVGKNVKIQLRDWRIFRKSVLDKIH